MCFSRVWQSARRRLRCAPVISGRWVCTGKGNFREGARVSEEGQPPSRGPLPGARRPQRRMEPGQATPPSAAPKPLTHQTVSVSSLCSQVN